jgi:hypothetical protein
VNVAQSLQFDLLGPLLRFDRIVEVHHQVIGNLAKACNLEGNSPCPRRLRMRLIEARVGICCPGCSIFIGKDIEFGNSNDTRRKLRKPTKVVRPASYSGQYATACQAKMDLLVEQEAAPESDAAGIDFFFIQTGSISSYVYCSGIVIEA